jgi:hypothetical protein
MMITIQRNATWTTVLDSMSREHINSATFDQNSPTGLVLKALCDDYARHMNNAVDAAESLQAQLSNALESGRLTGGLAHNSTLRRYDEALAAMAALNTPLMAAAMGYVESQQLAKASA